METVKTMQTISAHAVALIEDALEEAALHLSDKTPAKDALCGYIVELERKLAAGEAASADDCPPPPPPAREEDYRR